MRAKQVYEFVKGTDPKEALNIGLSNMANQITSEDLKLLQYYYYESNKDDVYFKNNADFYTSEEDYHRLIQLKPFYEKYMLIIDNHFGMFATDDIENHIIDLFSETDFNYVYACTPDYGYTIVLVSKLKLPLVEDDLMMTRAELKNRSLL